MYRLCRLFVKAMIFPNQRCTINICCRDGLLWSQAYAAVFKQSFDKAYGILSPIINVVSINDITLGSTVNMPFIPSELNQSFKQVFNHDLRMIMNTALIKTHSRDATNGMVYNAPPLEKRIASCNKPSYWIDEQWANWATKRKGSEMIFIVLSIDDSDTSDFCRYINAYFSEAMIINQKMYTSEFDTFDENLVDLNQPDTVMDKPYSQDELHNIAYFAHTLRTIANIIDNTLSNLDNWNIHDQKFYNVMNA